MTGRTLLRYTRVYVDGLDMSGYGREVGPLVADFSPTDVTATMSDSVRGFLPGVPSFTPTAFNTVMDDTATTGPVDFNKSKTGTARNVLVALGDRAGPAIGVPAFWGVYEMPNFDGVENGGAITCSMKLGGFDTGTTAALLYRQVWGNLLHAYGNETAVNSANTNIDGLAASSKGGILVYHIASITGSGTVTLSVDDSSTGSSGWATLTGSSTSAIATASAPVAGYVQTSVTQAVKRYTRWQIAFGGSATGCTWVAAFIRGV